MFRKRNLPSCMHLNATRWPERETRNGHGRIATRTAHYDSEFVRHWAADYDWRRCEAKPDGPHQFITEISFRTLSMWRFRDCLAMGFQPRLLRLTNGSTGYVIW